MPITNWRVSVCETGSANFTVVATGFKNYEDAHARMIELNASYNHPCSLNESETKPFKALKFAFGVEAYSEAQSYPMAPFSGIDYTYYTPMMKIDWSKVAFGSKPNGAEQETYMNLIQAGIIHENKETTPLYKEVYANSKKWILKYDNGYPEPYCDKDGNLYIHSGPDENKETK